MMIESALYLTEVHIKELKEFEEILVKTVKFNAESSI